MAGFVNYSSLMFVVRETEVFAKWLGNLPDRAARTRIAARIERLKFGAFGDVKFFSGIGELRFAFGPGYRVYFTQRGQEIIILLCGGDKGSQKRDIAKAIEMAQEDEE